MGRFLVIRQCDQIGFYLRKENIETLFKYIYYVINFNYEIKTYSISKNINNLFVLANPTSKEAKAMKLHI